MTPEERQETDEKLGLIDPELSRVELAEELPASPVNERASIASMFGDISLG